MWARPCALDDRVIPEPVASSFPIDKSSSLCVDCCGGREIRFHRVVRLLEGQPPAFTSTEDAVCPPDQEGQQLSAGLYDEVSRFSSPREVGCVKH